MGVYDINVVSTEQTSQLPDSYRIPVPFARQKMDMHTELGKFVKKDAALFIGIYEDNDTLRENLSYLIKGSGLLRFAGAYSDGRNILQKCKTNPPNVILPSS